MRNIKIILIFMLFFVLSACVSSLKKSHLKESNFINKLKVGRASKKDVEQVLGKPSKVDTTWVYVENDYDKLTLFFEGETLSGISLYVEKGDKFNSVEVTFNEIIGDWTVQTEPMSNPHYGPQLCYLEDLKNGKRIKINGYKKVVEHISIWKPTKEDKSIKSHLYRNVGKEFCIGSSCSKVTDPKAWEHDHCKWLKDMVQSKKN